MYINFWYPVARCEEVTNEAPVRVRILCVDFVAFRDSDGNAHVLSDTCIHRGGALGNGKVLEDRIQCPYHGWQFDGDGKCQGQGCFLPAGFADGQNVGGKEESRQNANEFSDE